MIHYTTSNLSFLRQFAYLRELNCHINILKLIDPSLLYVDPYDNDLSIDQKEAIVEECKNNIWYFIREVLRIKFAGDYEHFHKANANMVLIQIIEAFINNKNRSIWSTSPRQQYGTMTDVSLILFHLLFTPKARVAILGNNSVDLFNKTTLPQYISELYESKKDQMVYINASRSKKIDSKGLLDKFEKNSITHLVIDDIEFIPGIGEFLSNWYDRYKSNSEKVPIIYADSTVSRQAKEYGIIDILGRKDIVTQYTTFYDGWIYDFKVKTPIINIFTHIDTIDPSGKEKEKFKRIFKSNLDIYEKEILLKR